MKLTLLVSFLLLSFGTTDAQHPSLRHVISLNGVWQIAEGDTVEIPERFDHSVPVPGLVSLASPPFRDAGPRVADRTALLQRDTVREAFWYRRRFTVGDVIPFVATLKVAKAMFGTKVFLNGIPLGEHLPCFTPGFFDATRALKKGENEIVIRVGSSRGSLPLSIPTGFDFEKERYIPGIFDDVDLILSGTPRVIRVQTAPDIEHNRLRVQVALGSDGILIRSGVVFTIREAKTHRLVARISREMILDGPKPETIREFTIPLDTPHRWTPEDPFLYDLSVRTTGDEASIRFGMREFRFDARTRKAVLNGIPYFMRGSNVTVYRFFEDAQCGSLPWNAQWVRALHKSFKQFHWNSLRYCIGFPPEEWYRIADEEGFLIQDEFPIWYGAPGWYAWPEGLGKDELAREYAEWMEERWNHPCVVIWDASNETVSNFGKTDETADAIRIVRRLDLSARPWDNGYSKHRERGDVFESHPYHFFDSKFTLRGIATADSVPRGNLEPNTGEYPVIINEYGWLWLNRDGSPTTLTQKLYANLLGENATVEERRHTYATYLAAETEFWRCHRQCAAVMHFTALGYSRADGQTSDHFTDVAGLVYEREFLKYLPDAFSPVGLMLDEWGAPIAPGAAHDFRILAINDLGSAWNGVMRLQILAVNEVLADSSVTATLSPYGRASVVIPCTVPRIPGTYTVQAILEKIGEKSVRSIREIPVR